MEPTSRETNESRSYHHGDLRRALIEAAVVAIAERGPAAVSLRELARRVGVSHAAPAHHFGNKTGLLTAVAAEGYRRLSAVLRDAYEATGSFLEVGVAYVRFAVTNRAYFDVMFRPDLLRLDDPELAEARAAAREMLYSPAAEVTGAGPGDETLHAGVAAWSLAHGLATLWVTGNLPPAIGEDPEAAARAVLAHLAGPPPRSDG